MRRVFRDVLVHQLDIARPREGRDPHQQLIKYTAAGIEVGAVIDIVPHRLLGRKILRRAQNLSGARHGLVIARATVDPRNAKINQFDKVICPIAMNQENVVRLYIAMNDAVLMRALKRAEQLAHNPDARKRAQTPHLLKALRQ